MQQLPLAKGIPLFEERAITAPPLHIVFTHAAAILALAHLFLGVGGVWFLNFDPFIFTVTFLGLILFGRGRLARQARRMLPVHYALFVRDEEIGDREGSLCPLVRLPLLLLYDHYRGL